MSDGPAAPDPRQQVRDLMGRATLLRVKGESAQALKLAQEALVLNEQNWEVHEFMGDMLMALNRGAEALVNYQRARELNPSRVELEDKVARAAVRRSTYQDQMSHMQAMIEGRAPQEQVRKPSYAALLSLLLPGLGQCYNGQLGKGFGIMAGYLVLALLTFYSAVAKLAGTRTGYGYGGVDYAAVLSAAAIWIVPLVLLWIYAVAEAAWRAHQTSTSDRTGLV